MINLYVYQSDTIELSDDEARELTSMTKGKRSGREPRVIGHVGLSREKDWYDVTPGPFVGRFSLCSGRTVDIASRFPFQNLAILLGLGNQARLLSETSTPGLGGPGLVDLVGLAFAREAERITAFGMEKGYETRTITRPPFAGVPDVTAHLTSHAGRPDRLVTKARRLTTDIPINRLIAHVLGLLGQLSYQDHGLSVRLRSLAPAFHHIPHTAGAPVVPPADQVPPRYREIYQLALVVLNRHTTLPTGSGVAGVNVLFNMTKIWEAYVRTWLSRDLQPGQRLALQHHDRYPRPAGHRPRRVNTMPDIGAPGRADRRS
jgi:5-methylcytosine-specific restriction endonuclease McrBC regulatory subunit McrC